VDGQARQLVALLDHRQEQAHQIGHVQVRHRRFPLAAEDTVVPAVTEPGPREHVQRRILAPVAVHRSHAHDRAGEPLDVLTHHLLALALAAGEGEGRLALVALVDDLVSTRELAGGQRAGEDEAIGAEQAGELEHVLRAEDVGPLVLRVLHVVEIVVAGQVEHHAGAAVALDAVDHLAQRVPAGDVDLGPAHVLVVENPRGAPGTTRQAEQPVPAGRGEPVDDQKERGDRLDHDREADQFAMVVQIGGRPAIGQSHEQVEDAPLDGEERLGEGREAERAQEGPRPGDTR